MQYLPDPTACPLLPRRKLYHKGFSKANRNGGRNDFKNNKLAFLFIDFINFFEPETASFENVTGVSCVAQWSSLSFHFLLPSLSFVIESFIDVDKD